jgi:hypothetical protein
MAKEIPLWRKAFDAVEVPLRVRAESAASTAEFAQALLMLFQVSTTLGKAARSTSSRLWHVANLPSYSDMRRLFRQIGALENRLDRMNVEIERLARRLDELSAKRSSRKAPAHERND